MTVSTDISKYIGNATRLADIWGGIIVNVKALPYLAKGDGTTDDTAAIQAAINDHPNVYFPPGTYSISRPLVMRDARKALIGNSKETTELKPASNFAASTIGDRTVSALIWYNTEGEGWVAGGTISGFSLLCNTLCEGIHFSGVNNGQVVKDMYMFRPTIGIHNALNGWGHGYENVFIEGATEYSVKLGFFSNGVNLVNCQLWGGEWLTPTHLLVENSSFGVSVVGGFIENCDVGIRVHKQSQVTVTGIDMEMCNLVFIESIGLYDETGTVLIFANPPSHVSGCTFVGVPSQSAIAVRGGMMGLYDNNFISNGETDTVPCLDGGLGGNTYAPGVEPQCISESGNDFTQWAIKSQGSVFTRMGALNVGSSAFSKLVVGRRSSRLTETQGWDIESVGQARLAKQFGLLPPAFNTDTPTLTVLGLGDRTKTDDPENYVYNYLGLDTAALKLTANLQLDAEPYPTYGKAKLTASVTTSAGKTSEFGITVDSILEAVTPLYDNSIKLGSSAMRWTEVWATNGTIQTSDGRQKTDISDSDLGLNFISSLRPVSYKWITGKNVTRDVIIGYTEIEVGRDEEGNPIYERVPQYETEIVETIPGLRPHYGLIAQEVKSVMDGQGIADFAGFIHDSGTDYMGLRYEEFIAPLIKAVQELKSEVELLKSLVITE